MTFDEWMLTVNPLHQPTDDGMDTRLLRKCWEAARVGGATQEGPWCVFSVYAQHEVRTPSGTLVAVVNSRDDARLISAAPDLLAALQELRYACTDKAEVMADAAVYKAIGNAASKEQKRRDALGPWEDKA